MLIYQAPGRVGAPGKNGWVSVARACRSRARRASFPNTMFLLSYCLAVMTGSRRAGTFGRPRHAISNMRPHVEVCDDAAQLFGPRDRRQLGLRLLPHRQI